MTFNMGLLHNKNLDKESEKIIHLPQDKNTVIKIELL